MNNDDRLISSVSRDEDFEIETDLRPKWLQEYIGQDKAKEQLNIFIKAAKSRKEPLDHSLLFGPPGLGKTTLAHIIANEMGVNIRITSGPAIERQGDLASILTNLSKDDVLFIDEIHRLNRSVEEILYPAMEAGLFVSLHMKISLIFQLIVCRIVAMPQHRLQSTSIGLLSL